MSRIANYAAHNLLDTALLLGGAALAVYLLARNSEAVARGLVGGALSVTGDATAGIIEGIGSSVGVPLTDNQQCAADVAAGNKSAGLVDCTMSQYASWLFSGFATDHAVTPYER